MLGSCSNNYITFDPHNPFVALVAIQKAYPLLSFELLAFSLSLSAFAYFYLILTYT